MIKPKYFDDWWQYDDKQGKYTLKSNPPHEAVEEYNNFYEIIDSDTQA